MAVDDTSLERIRKATFPASRRGYDRREVEKFLNRLADWLETGGGDQARSDTVRRELERVGERTGAILSEAEDSAQQIRGEAEQEMAQLRTDAVAEADRTRGEADAYAAETRAGADAYAKETRAETDAYAEQTRTDADSYAQQTEADADLYAQQARNGAEQEADRTRAQAEQDTREAAEAAEAQARRTVDEGLARRRDIESVIGDLADRRDQAIGELESLRLALEAAISDHALSDEDEEASLSTDDSVNGDTVEAHPAEIEGFEEFEDDTATSFKGER